MPVRDRACAEEAVILSPTATELCSVAVVAGIAIAVNSADARTSRR